MLKVKQSLAGALAILLCATAALVPARVQAAQKFVASVTPLLDAAGGKSIGSVGPGSAVDVTGTSGSATHVTLHGWYAAGSTVLVYMAPDKHIVALSGFTGKGVAGAAQAVTIDGWVASAALTDDVQTVWKTASALYAQKCGQCHALQPVTSYSANQWPAIMKTQADNANLDAGQTALLTAYLQVQSGH
jgi:hypothetical protein